MFSTHVEIEFAGETRSVEVHTFGDEIGPETRLFSESVFAAFIGNGTKANRSEIVLWPVEDAADARRKGHRIVVEVEGYLFGAHLSTCVRNRQARITGWASTYEGTGAGAAHNAYNAIN